MTSLPLSFLHLPLNPNHPLPDAIRHRLLGMLSFSSQPMASEDCLLHAAMPGGNDIAEVWLGRANVMAGEQDAIRFRHDGQWLFGIIELPETQTTPDVPPLQSTTESAYRRIFALLEALEYPHVYRFWNYMADINNVSHELERYRQFNLGRQEAFLAYDRAITGALPAACALGLMQGSLKIAFLAGRISATAIENPRQVSAYDYPQEYGPRSPTFSRACLLPESGLLLISGTASILGHQTMHVGDVEAQTRETLANLEAVVAEANRHVPSPGFATVSMSYRIYMRRSEDQAIIQETITRTLGTGLKTAFVQADICRSDLLLEIEATASLASGQP